MPALIKICEALLPIAYTGAVGAYALAFTRRDDPGLVGWRRPLLVAALVLHTTLIYAQTSLNGHCLVYTPFELLTLISFTVTLTYFVVELATKEQGTGVFFLGLALVLQTISAMFGGSEVAPAALLNNIVALHISAALIGYTAFTISAVYGALYLMLFHKIKSNSFGTFYNRLPSLQLLEKMSEKSAIVGLIFLTAAIVIAGVLLPGVLPGFTYGDPKIIMTLAIWLVYVGALLARYLGRVEARKVVIASLVGFVGTLLSMTVVNFLLGSFHKFG